jgi:hypothetical protein
LRVGKTKLLDSADAAHVINVSRLFARIEASLSILKDEMVVLPEVKKKAAAVD